MSYGEQDKREAERKYLVFYLRVFDGLSSTVLGHLINISEKGAMVIGDRQMIVNQDYLLRMKLPAQVGERHEIAFMTTCRWCKPDTNPDFYVAGFQMHDLDLQTKTMIGNMVRDFGFDHSSLNRPA